MSETQESDKDAYGEITPLQSKGGVLGQLNGVAVHLLADVFEVAWPFVLNSSAGFSKWPPLLAVALQLDFRAGWFGWFELYINIVDPFGESVRRERLEES